jgi:hypothetical protein
MNAYVSRFTFLLLCITASTSAQQGKPVAQHTSGALYLDVASLLLCGSASLNYELPLGAAAALRLGVGTGYMNDLGGSSMKFSSGVLLMPTFLIGGEDTYLEIAFGGSFNAEVGRPDLALLPAAIVGYRSQPAEGGVLFRMGVGYTFSYGFPFYISIGTSW